MYLQAALCGAKFFRLHDRKSPPNATFNVYQAADDHWFIVVVVPKDWPAFAKPIGHPELLADARFADAAAQAANSAQLTAIIDGVFRAQPLAYWGEALDRAHITYGVVHSPW